jgi:hypothetical protein
LTKSPGATTSSTRTNETPVSSEHAGKHITTTATAHAAIGRTDRRVLRTA